MRPVGHRNDELHVPTVDLPIVYHVGTMDPTRKGVNSYEGAGLSVSLHPSAWRRIARGMVGGETFRLTHGKGTFLDALSLEDELRREILGWAVANGYATIAHVWTLSWTEWDDDSEDELERSCNFLDQKRAEAEALEYDQHDARIASSMQHVSTPYLDLMVMSTRTSIGDRDVLDMVLPAWAVQVRGLAGVWWNERYAPMELSAPRGVIDPSRLGEWRIERANADPDDDIEEDFYGIEVDDDYGGDEHSKQEPGNPDAYVPKTS